jgi:hypothetical protein
MHTTKQNIVQVLFEKINVAEVTFGHNGSKLICPIMYCELSICKFI